MTCTFGSSFRFFTSYLYVQKNVVGKVEQGEPPTKVSYLSQLLSSRNSYLSKNFQTFSWREDQQIYNNFIIESGKRGFHFLHIRSITYFSEKWSSPQWFTSALPKNHKISKLKLQSVNKIKTPNIERKKLFSGSK